MTTYRKSLLKIQSPSMGPIVIQPYAADAEDVEGAKLVLFPYRFSAGQIDTAAEWAVSSQCPIFCHEGDIPLLEREGFGAYRFHKLGGYKHIDFQGGSVELFPAQGAPKKGLLNALNDFMGVFRNAKNIYAYHVLVRPLGEKSVLLVSSPYVDVLEWPVLLRAKPEVIVLSSEFSKEQWKDFIGRYKLNPNFAADFPVVDTQREDPKHEKENENWKAKAI